MADNKGVERWQTLKESPVEDHFVVGMQYITRRSPRTGHKADYVVFRSPTWVNVIALTPAEEVVLVRQYRHGVDDITLEIPGGMVDEGEDPKTAGLRELLEETGYAGDEVIHLGTVDANPALFDNQTHSYLVKNARLIQAPEPDAGEDIEVLRVPLKDIPKRIACGDIRHSLVVAAFFHLQNQGNSAG